MGIYIPDWREIKGIFRGNISEVSVRKPDVLGLSDESKEKVFMHLQRIEQEANDRGQLIYQHPDWNRLDHLICNMPYCREREAFMEAKEFALNRSHCSTFEARILRFELGMDPDEGETVNYTYAVPRGSYGAAPLKTKD